MTPAVPYQSIDQQISRQAVERGDKPYAIAAETGDVLTYRGLDAATNRICHFLASRGIKAESRIAVLSDNCLAQVVLYLGVQRYGATICLVNCEVNAMNVAQILYDLEPAMVFAHEALTPALQETAREAGGLCLRFADFPRPAPGNDFFNTIAELPDQACTALVGNPKAITMINYTSGTTSKPKGVLYQDEALFLATDSVAAGFDITERDRVLEFRALTWFSAQVLSFLPVLQVGATLVLAKRFSVTHFFDWIKKHGVTISAGVPTAVTMLLERPVAVTQADVPTLRYMIASSAPIAPETYEAFQKRYGITLSKACGMSEAGFMFSNGPDVNRPGTVGRPQRNLIARFVDEEGRDTPPRVEGELMVDGPQLSYGYLLGRNDVQPRPAGGFRTGDLGYFDEDGYAYLSGRKKDLIIKGGVNIAPLEITTILCEHPAVLEAATIGIPDRIYGEAVACFVVPQPGKSVTVEAITEHLRPRLSDFKMPQAVMLMASLPKTDRGKVSKEGLLKAWQERQGG